MRHVRKRLALGVTLGGMYAMLLGCPVPGLGGGGGGCLGMGGAPRPPGGGGGASPAANPLGTDGTQVALPSPQDGLLGQTPEVDLGNNGAGGGVETAALVPGQPDSTSVGLRPLPPDTTLRFPGGTGPQVGLADPRNPLGTPPPPLAPDAPVPRGGDAPPRVAPPSVERGATTPPVVRRPAPPGAGTTPAAPPRVTPATPPRAVQPAAPRAEPAPGNTRIATLPPSDGLKSSPVRLQDLGRGQAGGLDLYRSYDSPEGKYGISGVLKGQAPDWGENCKTFAFGDRAPFGILYTPGNLQRRNFTGTNPFGNTSAQKGDVVTLQAFDAQKRVMVDHAAVYAGRDARGKAVYLQRNGASDVMMVDEDYLAAMAWATSGNNAKVDWYVGSQFAGSRAAFDNTPFRGGSVNRFMNP